MDAGRQAGISGPWAQAPRSRAAPAPLRPRNAPLRLDSSNECQRIVAVAVRRRDVGQASTDAACQLARHPNPRADAGTIQCRGLAEAPSRRSRESLKTPSRRDSASPASVPSSTHMARAFAGVDVLSNKLEIQAEILNHRRYTVITERYCMTHSDTGHQNLTV